ncbi:MAG TPA: hypothetical protein VFR86_26355 [Burkholderiaceae bacterium]|nr:hypothetical protein [Burkholderiaceae bacterium]
MTLDAPEVPQNSGVAFQCTIHLRQRLAALIGGRVELQRHLQVFDCVLVPAACAQAFSAAPKSAHEFPMQPFTQRCRRRPPLRIARERAMKRKGAIGNPGQHRRGHVRGRGQDDINLTLAGVEARRGLQRGDLQRLKRVVHHSFSANTTLVEVSCDSSKHWNNQPTGANGIRLPRAALGSLSIRRIRPPQGVMFFP